MDSKSYMVDGAGKIDIGDPMRLSLKIITLIVIMMVAMAGGAWAGPAAPSDNGGILASKGPKAVFPQTKYEFETLFEGDDITHDFVVENSGDAPLIIKKVKPG